MNDDIGVYYERKRQEKRDAARMYEEHRNACPDCDPLINRLCKTGRVLKARWYDAGYTGD